MDYFPSRTCSRFRSLLDTVAADSVGLNALPPHPSVLGPSVGDDNTAPIPNLTVLGPCVGDDVVISDARLKQDVHRIGTTVFGLPLYRFKYLGKSETYEGVMAQDVLRVMPNAVSAGAEGFYRVNYGAL